jgi:hypothetical protein
MTSRAVLSTRAVSNPAAPHRRASAALLPDPPASSGLFPLVLIPRCAPVAAMEAGAEPRALARLLLHGE